MPAHEPLEAGVSSLVARQLVTPGKCPPAVSVGTTEWSLASVNSAVSFQMGKFEIYKMSG